NGQVKTGITDGVLVRGYGLNNGGVTDQRVGGRGVRFVFHRQLAKAQIRPRYRIANTDVNGSIGTADLFPVLDNAREQVANLIPRQIGNRISGIYDDCHAVGAEHMDVEVNAAGLSLIEFG